MEILRDTAQRLASASVTPSDPAFAPAIESLVTAIVASSKQPQSSAYQAVFRLWNEELTILGDAQQGGATTHESITNGYLHALLLALSTVNDGTSSTGEHMLTHVLFPLLDMPSSDSFFDHVSSVMPTCLEVLASACSRYSGQLEIFCRAALLHFSQELVLTSEDELESTRMPWRNWSTSLLRVCATALNVKRGESKNEAKEEKEKIASTMTTVVTSSFSALEFLKMELLPQLCRCVLNVETEHARIGALRIFADPTVRAIFIKESDVMTKLWQGCVDLWKQNDVVKKTRRISYDVLAHTFDLYSSAHLSSDAWTIILEGLIPDSKDEIISKISLHLLHLACQRVYDEERWTEGEKKNEGENGGENEGAKQQLQQHKSRQTPPGMLQRQRWGRRMEQFRALYSVLDEFAQHLIDSMWPEMENLYLIDDEGENKGEEEEEDLNQVFPPKYLTPNFQWTSLILRKAFRHDNPSVRAQLIQRFLEFPFVNNFYASKCNFACSRCPRKNVTGIKPIKKRMACYCEQRNGLYCQRK